MDTVEGLQTDSKCILITNSEEATLNCEGIDIDVVPIWKWLLDTNM